MRPRSRGWSWNRQRTSGTTSSAAPAVVMAAERQPWFSASQARNGRKASWPVAPAAVSTPLTRPRRATNQRAVTTATRDMDIAPVPRPTRMPQQRMSCHDAVIQIGSTDPTETRTSAQPTTRLIPNRSMRAAENGAVSPNSTRLTETASPMSPIGQPNSSCSGVMSTPGVDRKPAAPMAVRNATRATHQAGWIRGVGRGSPPGRPSSARPWAAGSVVVTMCSLPDRRGRTEVAGRTGYAKIRP